MEAFSRVLSVFLLITALYFCPLFLMAGISETVMELRVMEAETTFVEKVKYSGHVSKGLYEELLSKLETTGAVYDIQMEHGRKLAEPEWEEGGDGVYIYYTAYGTEDILSSLYEQEERYHMVTGDTFQVRIRNISGSLASRFRRMLYGSAGENLPALVYGGVICDESE